MATKKTSGQNNLPDRSRRQAVKTIVGGFTAVAAFNLLPNQWRTPVVESVFLPAHAATSGLKVKDPCTAEIISGDQGTATVEVQVSGYITPPVGDLPTKIQYTPVGAGAPVAVETTTTADGSFGATTVVAGGPGITGVEVTTTVDGAIGSASCNAEVGEPPATRVIRNNFFQARETLLNGSIHFRITVESDPPPHPTFTVHLEIYNETTGMMMQTRNVTVEIFPSGIFSSFNGTGNNPITAGDQLTFRINTGLSTIPEDFVIINFPETITVTL